MFKKVLIVEDELDLIRLLKYNLEKEGFKVSAASELRHQAVQHA